MVAGGRAGFVADPYFMINEGFQGQPLPGAIMRMIIWSKLPMCQQILNHPSKKSIPFQTVLPFPVSLDTFFVNISGNGQKYRWKASGRPIRRGAFYVQHIHRRNDFLTGKKPTLTFIGWRNLLIPCG